MLARILLSFLLTSIDCCCTLYALHFILQIGFYCGFLAVLRSELDAGNYVLNTSKSKIADKYM